MKGFIEVINQIKDECGSHDSCNVNCVFFKYMDAEGNRVCVLNVPPEYFDPLDIIRRLQSHD